MKNIYLNFAEINFIFILLYKSLKNLNTNIFMDRVKEIYRIFFGYDADEFRKVRDLSQKEFLEIGRILDSDGDKSFWTHYRKDNREMEYSAPRDVGTNTDKKIILKYNGELILPKETSYEKWFAVECYLASRGIERKIFTEDLLKVFK